MKRIKYLTLLLAALICSTTITAQGIKIYQKNGTTLDLSYTEIDSIVAYGNNNTNDDKHEAVDLGLSVKWATCNVGAESPEEYGDYFAWGETTTKSEDTYENSKTCGKNIGDIAGNPAYDAATANWGGSWRMPTKAEFEELINNCTWQWTTQGGKNGYKVTSKINGNSIFLSAAGYRNGSSLNNAGYNGNYLSSTPNESNTQNAYNLNFNSGNHNLNWNNRNNGQSVSAGYSRPCFVLKIDIRSINRVRLLQLSRETLEIADSACFCFFI